jgi:DNA-binding beta-propeller fold protein YncE
MKRLMLFCNISIIILVFAQPLSLFAQSAGYKVVGNIIIGGPSKWDYLSIYKPLNQLFVSHESEVDVINLENNSVIGKIDGLKSTHGIAFSNKYEKGFITDGKDNSVVIFNLRDIKIVQKVKTTGDGPDAIAFDPFTERIFSFNGDGENATAIDAKTNEVVGTVKLTGGPESGVSDFKGHMFVNIEKGNEINVFDTKTLTVLDKWKITPCEQPTAMAIDRVNNRLFIGGRNQIFAVIDASTGNVITTFPIGKGVDACVYDPETHLIFCSNKDATITVMGQESADKYELIGSITTLPGAKTMALDEVSHKIYSSTMIAVENDKKSFGVLIIDRK